VGACLRKPRAGLRWLPACIIPASSPQCGGSRGRDGGEEQPLLEPRRNPAPVSGTSGLNPGSAAARMEPVAAFDSRSLCGRRCSSSPGHGTHCGRDRRRRRGGRGNAGVSRAASWLISETNRHPSFCRRWR
jgi:hypothetical protein